ncbi:Hypothetical predicted protein, partial [Pelobates cultripes]
FIQNGIATESRRNPAPGLQQSWHLVSTDVITLGRNPSSSHQGNCAHRASVDLHVWEAGGNVKGNVVIKLDKFQSTQGTSFTAANSGRPCA